MSNLLAWASRILIESILAFKKLLKSTGPLRPAMGPTPMHLRDPRSVPVRGPWAVLLGVLSQWILGVLSKYISGVLHLRGPRSVQLRGPPSRGSLVSGAHTLTCRKRLFNHGLLRVCPGLQCIFLPPFPFFFCLPPLSFLSDPRAHAAQAT